MLGAGPHGRVEPGARVVDDDRARRAPTAAVGAARFPAGPGGPDERRGTRVAGDDRESAHRRGEHRGQGVGGQRQGQVGVGGPGIGRVGARPTVAARRRDFACRSSLIGITRSTAAGMAPVSAPAAGRDGRIHLVSPAGAGVWTDDHGHGRLRAQSAGTRPAGSAAARRTPGGDGARTRR